jgi:aspartyl-tRNA(Asn)/glutamyl-tRNA(Gln) amidotransferase subunit A
MSVPCGLSEGLPVGIQIVAPPLADDRLYQVGAALEAAQDATRGHPLLAEIGALS